MRHRRVMTIAGSPTFDNLTIVAGVDEAGRGPLAGPVVAAAVRLDPARIPPGLNDSKKLTASARARLFDLLMAEAGVAVAEASVAEIDSLNDRLPGLKSFILPGGTPAAAALHLARTVSRRAEREDEDCGQETHG